MSSTLVITLVTIGAVAWLAFLGVSALRARGREEIPPNLAPGTTDDQLETRRLERVQQAAVLLSAFLALGLPLYYLGETDRQEGFEEQFQEESVARGAALFTEFGCDGCHAPDGSGGAAAYVERRSGITVSWAAPSLNDIYYRYDHDEVVYWITFGRKNTPMPAWGVEGGGAMNEQQIEDIANYLATEEFQISQEEALAQIDAQVNASLSRLESADQIVERAIAEQRQLIADIRRAETQAPIATELAARAQEALDNAAEGIDTDGDGLSDAAEQAISEITAEARDAFTVPIPQLTLSPEAAQSEEGRDDRQAAEEALATVEELATEHPLLEGTAAAIAEALAMEGEDTDGDGLTDEAEQVITQQLAAAAQALEPEITVVTLDPANPASVGGEPDAATADRAVSTLDTFALTLTVTRDNIDRILPNAESGLEYLLEAQRRRAWEVDIAGVAELAFEGDMARAERAVGLYNGYCARCHTSGWSAGIPFTQEPGSGGFGPALWEGRANVQFLEKEELVDFIAVGSIPNEPYGVNGMGTGRMPGFGQVLSAEDLDLIATYLRSGEMDGMTGDE